MSGFSDLFQKAVYLGVGLASYAGEKAGTKLTELRAQAQKLADELVARGEMTTEEARRMVDDLVQQAQTPGAEPTPDQPREPRRIEIVDDEEPAASAQPTGAPPVDDVERLRQQVQSLQDELRRLRRD